MKGKGLWKGLVMLMALLIVAGASLALPNIESVKINGDVFNNGDNLVVYRGDVLNFKVKLNTTSNDTNIELRADLIGYEHNNVDKISDSTGVFDMFAGETLYKTLSVTIPENAEKDEYDLRLRLAGRTGASSEHTYRIKIKTDRHGLAIRDVLFSPAEEVLAGRALLSTVRVRNVGEKTEENIKVRVSIPSLGLSATNYIDEISPEESVETDEMYLRIPSCTDEGLYTVNIDVLYNDGYDKVSKQTVVKVAADESCAATPQQIVTPSVPEKTIINVGSVEMSIAQGNYAIYPITVTNAGSSSKVYTFAIDGVSGWANARVSPTNAVVISAGETKSIYLYVTPLAT